MRSSANMSVLTSEHVSVHKTRAALLSSASPGVNLRERAYQRLRARYSFRERYFSARQTRKETAIVAFQRAVLANLIIHKSSLPRGREKERESERGEGHFSK